MAKRLMRPLANEEPNLLKEAFFNVPLYKDVWAAFEEDGRIPEGLGIRLERNFDLMEGVGDYAARILKESARQAGLLTEDGSMLIDLHVEHGSEQDKSDGREEGTPPPPQDKRRDHPDTIEYESIVFVLPHPRTEIRVPSKLTQAQREKVGDWINKVILPSLEFLEGHEEGD